MSAPSKAWEGNIRNNNSSFLQDISPTMPASSGTRMPPVLVRHSQPGIPPLPPRSHSRQYSRMGYGGWGGAYGGYGMAAMPYGYGSYGGYGRYGGGYGGYDFENRYVQIAEESAAPAFESIESFVRSFSSVTMMLESTFQAMHMSFRAVLGVAENMSRMKQVILDFLSAFAIMKTVYSFYRKVLQLLGLVNKNEATWAEAQKVTLEAAVVPARRRVPKWPILAFLGAIIAGPALVYKYLLPDGIPEEEEVELVGAYEFEAEQPGELSFSKGDRLFCAKSQLKKHWIMAKKGASKGLIPCNRVRLVNRNGAAGVPSNLPADTTIAARSSQLIQPQPSQPVTTIAAQLTPITAQATQTRPPTITTHLSQPQPVPHSANFQGPQPTAANPRPKPLLDTTTAAQPKPLMDPTAAAQPKPFMDTTTAAQPKPFMDPTAAAQPKPFMGATTAAQPKPFMDITTAAQPKPLIDTTTAAQPKPYELPTGAFPQTQTDPKKEDTTFVLSP